MAYADSAIDYKWSITNISVEQGLMTVKYDPADSTDSSRPSIFRNIQLEKTEYNDSDILTKVKAQVKGVITRWDQILEDIAANPSFNADSYVGVENNNRYVPLVFDSQPAFNDLTSKLQTTVTEDSYAITTSYSVVAMSDSEKGDRRSELNVDIPALWLCLESDGRLDSVVDALGADSATTFDKNEIIFERGDYIYFDDSLAGELKTILGYSTDSDYAVFLKEVSGKSFNFYRSN